MCLYVNRDYFRVIRFQRIAFYFFLFSVLCGFLSDHALPYIQNNFKAILFSEGKKSRKTFEHGKVSLFLFFLGKLSQVPRRKRHKNKNSHL